MNNKVSKTLLALSQTDARILSVQTQKSQIEDYLKSFASRLRLMKSRLGEYEAAHKEGKLRQVLEEHRLRDEEQRIVDRRKQMTSIGGAKVAKMMEREIDIASRSIEGLEQKAMKAIEEVDQIEHQLTELRTELEKAEMQFESDSKEREGSINTFGKELSALNSEREELVGQLEDRVKNLYNRIRGRYQDGAVAVAENGSCRSCFRALPSQTYNQVLAGNLLIQCPGCSRILVHVDSGKTKQKD